MHIVLFSPIPYSFLHQRPQKIAEALSAKGIAVTYVEPRGWRQLASEGLLEIVRVILDSVRYHIVALLSLFLAFRPNVGRERKVRPAFRVVSTPLTIPLNRVDMAVVDTISSRVLEWFLAKEVLTSSGELPIAFVEHPFWGAVIARSMFSKIFYDCIDELRIFVGNNSPARFESYEQRLIANADGVFVTARALEERLRSIGRDVPVTRIPNGVDYDWFVERSRTSEISGELDGLERPIVGYVGALSSWIDYNLLSSVAELLPDVSFVFVGPIEDRSSVKGLTTKRRCVLLGIQPYDSVPSFINAFDVCLIPFRQGDIARTTNPIKIYEYFALGKPVVTTPVDEVAEFRSRGLVYWAESHEDFARCIRDALGENDPRKKEGRMEIARQNSWSSRVETMLSRMDS